MKRIVAILLVLTVCFAVFASGANESKTTESGKTVIRFMCGGAGYWDPNLNPAVEAYNASQDKYEVVVDYYQYDALLSNIEVKMGAKSKDYDLIAVDAPLVAAYANRGYIKSLNPYFSEDEINQFVESEKAASIWNGEFVAAPMNSSAQVLWYNKDLLTAAGYDFPSSSPEGRLSWEKLVEIAADVQKKLDPDGSQGLMGLMFEQVDRAYQMLALPNSLGAPSIGADGFTVDGILNSPEWIKALNFYQSLYTSGVAHKGVTAEEAAGYFLSGKVVFFIGATWTAGNAASAGLDVGYAPCPYFEGYEDKVATPCGGWHIGISSFTKNADACADFIKYITLGEGEKWNRNAGNVPSTYEGVRDVLATGEESVMTLSAYESGSTAYPRPVTPAYSEYETVVNQLFSDVRNGADVESTVADAIARLNTSMRKYK